MSQNIKWRKVWLRKSKRDWIEKRTWLGSVDLEWRRLKMLPSWKLRFSMLESDRHHRSDREERKKLETNTQQNKSPFASWLCFFFFTVPAGSFYWWMIPCAYMLRINVLPTHLSRSFLYDLIYCAALSKSSNYWWGWLVSAVIIFWAHCRILVKSGLYETAHY